MPKKDNSRRKIMNRNIIIAIIIIIIIAIVGVFAFTQGNNSEKTGTQINIISNATLQNGDEIQFELKDVNGNVLAGEQLNITFTNDEKNQTFTVVTDTQGKAYLLLENEEPGNRVVIASYAGNDKYDGFEAQKAITIEEGTSDSQSSASDSESSASTQQNSNQNSTSSSASSSSSSDSNLHYDSQYNIYYDDNGVVRGGQSDGMSVDEVRQAYESDDMIDENGNLQ